MTFVELPMIADTGEVVKLWLNTSAIAAVLEYDGRLMLSATNNPEAVEVDLPVTAEELVTKVLCSSLPYLDIPTVMHFLGIRL